MHTLLHRFQFVSGVVLLVYLLLHLVNHALGIWSLDLAGRGLVLALRLWHSVPGTVLLYGAALLHFLLALRTIYGRRYWALPLTEWVRLWAGLSLPLLLIRHAVIAASVGPLRPDPKLVANQPALDAWRHDISMLYLSLLLCAFVAGQLRNSLERRRLRKAAIGV